MNELIRIDNLFARRSIRKYTDEPVREEHILLLLKAGMAAPSASNLKPWHFIVITRRVLLNKLADIMPYGKMLAHAPLCISVCGDLGINERYWVQDCSAATENILLAATGLGLGAVWLGVYPRPERLDPVREALNIPEGIMPLNLLAIGHPAEMPPPRTQYEESRVHRDIW